jgi:Glycosyl transferase family 2
MTPAMAADFSVVAIIAAYNEADIIESVISGLIDQGIQIYFIDDGSTDGTAAAVERHVGRGVIAVERLENGSTARPFEWERILVRKTEIAAALEASWFIHHDADEFRESPWSHLSLKNAIRHVDALGYNAIDFAGLEFWPVDDRFRAGSDVRAALTFYSDLAPYDRVQVRCWKKTDCAVDLASTGGHEARFANRKVFPIRFLLRHYPIRGQAHGERKVFEERQGRFVPQERARGWHVQYDGIQTGASFIREAATLTCYDGEAVRRSVTLTPRYPEEIVAELTAARAELAIRTHDLHVRAGEVEQLNAALAREHEDARIRDGRLVDVSGELDRRVTELATAYADLNRLHGDINGLHGDLSALRGTVADLSRQLDAAASAHANLQTELTSAHEALERRTGEIDRWRAAVEGLTGRIQAFQDSFSWRWTAPLRAVYRMFGRT